MQTLRELQASLVRHERRMEEREFAIGDARAPAGFEKRLAETEYIVNVKKFRNAQGVRFLCPKCFKTNGGPVGTHQVICWSRSRGVPEDVHPGPGRWRLVGTSIDDLTLEAEKGKTRSVQLLGGCKWHGFVTNGIAE